MSSSFLERFLKKHDYKPETLEFLRFLGPGFIVTVGFIDPGNWASNVAAGAQFGYSILWIVTVATIMLIFLQHNAAHLGIVTGLCLAESAAKHFRPWKARIFLGSAFLACIATVLAELLGAAIGLNMLFRIPITIGAFLTAAVVSTLVFTNSYARIERVIIGMVSLIGIAFVCELFLVSPNWGQALNSAFVPSFPKGSITIIVSVLGAVVMPHNIFLHSEIIQSRQWNTQQKEVMQRQLRFEFLDTLAAMGLGWAINSAMIIVAAAVFFAHGIEVTSLEQAQETLRPLVGSAASIIFALALILAGISSSATASLAAGSVTAGIFGEPLDLHDSHTRSGILLALAVATIIIFFLKDTFAGLIWSQVALSLQLPLTIAGLIILTSSKNVMGDFANPVSSKILLWTLGGIVIALNAVLLVQTLLP